MTEQDYMQTMIANIRERAGNASVITITRAEFTDLCRAVQISEATATRLQAEPSITDAMVEAAFDTYWSEKAIDDDNHLRPMHEALKAAWRANNG
jgi:hypothetical protein